MKLTNKKLLKSKGGLHLMLYINFYDVIWDEFLCFAKCCKVKKKETPYTHLWGCWYCIFGILQTETPSQTKHHYKYYAMWKENLCSMKLEIMSHMWNSISVFMHHNNIMEHIIDIVLGGK
jgi:hypothetical protein